MGTLSTSALTDGGKALALSVALGLIMAFVPVVSLLAVPLLPLPTAFVTAKYGWSLGILVSLAAGAICLAITVPGGVFVYLLMALAGVGAGLGLRLGLPQAKLFVAVALFFLTALVGWAAFLLYSAGMGPVEATEAFTESTLALARETYVDLGIGEESIEAAFVQVREVAAVAPYLAPAGLLIASLVFAWINLAATRRWFARVQLPFPQDFNFRELRLHFAFAYLMILGLVLELLSAYVAESYTSPLGWTGMNLVIFAETLFFIQGLAIASYFLHLYRFSQAKRGVIYFCLVLLQFTLSLTSWLGLFDTWLDYRRRFSRKSTQSKRSG